MRVCVYIAGIHVGTSKCIHVFCPFSTGHSISWCTPLFLAPARCRSRNRWVCLLSTGHCRWSQTSSKLVCPALVTKAGSVTLFQLKGVFKTVGISESEAPHRAFCSWATLLCIHLHWQRKQCFAVHWSLTSAPALQCVSPSFQICRPPPWSLVTGSQTLRHVMCVEFHRTETAEGIYCFITNWPFLQWLQKRMHSLTNVF